MINQTYFLERVESVIWTILYYNRIKHFWNTQHNDPSSNFKQTGDLATSPSFRTKEDVRPSVVGQVNGCGSCGALPRPTSPPTCQKKEDGVRETRVLEEGGKKEEAVNDGKVRVTYLSLDFWAVVIIFFLVVCQLGTTLLHLISILCHT